MYGICTSKRKNLLSLQTSGFARPITNVIAGFPYALSIPFREGNYRFRAKIYKMDLFVRNLEKRTICALDDLARAQGKSRNQYLKEQLTLLAEFPSLQEREDRYRTLVQQLAGLIQENTQIIEDLMRILTEERSEETWTTE